MTSFIAFGRHAQERAMLRVAFAGTFPASLEQPVRRHLTTPCEIIVVRETDVLSRLEHIEVLVTMALTAEMARAATRLKLVQVPGAGLDRIDRSALPPGAMLANAHGHETGIAEYVIGAILALTREFIRLDHALRHGDWQSQWAVGVAPPQVWPELVGKTIGILGYGRIGHRSYGVGKDRGEIVARPPGERLRRAECSYNDRGFHPA